MLKSIKVEMIDSWSSKAEYKSEVNLFWASKVLRPGRNQTVYSFVEIIKKDFFRQQFKNVEQNRKNGN